MKTVSGIKLGSKLLKILGLPEKTIWFELRCHVNEDTKVTCGYSPLLGEAGEEELLEIVKHYELREISQGNPCDVVAPPDQEVCVSELEKLVTLIKEGKVSIRTFNLKRDTREVGIYQGYQHFELDRTGRLEMALKWPPEALS